MQRRKLYILVVPLLLFIFVCFYNQGKVRVHKNLVTTRKFSKLKIQMCKKTPENLIGNLSLKVNISEEFEPFSLKESLKKDEFNFIKSIKLGGSWEPKNCKSKSRVALIIPYKNRKENLRIFLYNMHPFLQRQELNYTIFLVEQINHGLFNKGIIMNAAFLEIIKKTSSKMLDDLLFDCIIFHDVDLLPTGKI